MVWSGLAVNVLLEQNVDRTRWADFTVDRGSHSELHFHDGDKLCQLMFLWSTNGLLLFSKSRQNN